LFIQSDDVEVVSSFAPSKDKDSIPMKEVPKLNTSPSGTKVAPKPPMTPVDKDKKKKKGLFGGLFGGKKKGRDNNAAATRSKRR